MRQTERQAKIRELTVVLLLAAARAQAQETENAPPAPRIIVSIPDRKLALIEDGRVVKVYAAAVGARVSPSPTGAFQIMTRLSRPTYYHPGVVIPPGKNNPLGTRWLGLSRKGFGIHGTNSPRSIGRAASHGCIRLRNRDIEELFELVRVGDIVELRGERDEQLARIFPPAAGATESQAGAATGGAE